MSFPSDLEIAQSCKMQHINDIAAKLNIAVDDLEHYGKFKAKLPLALINEEAIKKNKLILVSAVTPTPAGEGKTTTSIGLTEGLNKIGKRATVVLREPSLGPVFGIKGGAAGGGYAQVVPMEDINLHFTGDFSAIEKAKQHEQRKQSGSALGWYLKARHMYPASDFAKTGIDRVVTGLKSEPAAAGMTAP